MKSLKIHAKHNIFKTIFIFFLILNVFHTAYGQNDKKEKKYKLQTVVIDPGHGGKDSGARGSKSMEKDLVLDIGKRLGKYIENNLQEVKVIYTRKTDTFIPLYRRAEIANKNQADLFISLHINANPNHKARGTETYAMGLHKTESNLEVAKKENAVILYEEDYSQKYEGFDPKSAESYILFSLIQNTYLEQSLNFASFVQEKFTSNTHLRNRGVKQAGFLVLWKTTMPSVLVEAGFLSNPKEENYLLTEKGRDKLAKSIYEAFKNYKNKIEQKSVMLAKEEQDIKFSVQVAAAHDPIPLSSDYFKGHDDVQQHKISDTYKYTIGESPDYDKINKLKEKIEKDFPDAFIIAFKENKIIPVQKALKLKNQ
jgi:N-acetylmuramoyl-L-alanine amidase